MRAFALFAVLAVACGEPPPEIPDAGRDAGVEDAATGPMLSPVAPAEMPRFECPTGWAPTTLEGGPTVCDPFPMGHSVCGPNERQLPGEHSCVRIGPACPAGDWADDEPATGILYVRAAATDGDGTRAAPFGTVAEAVDAAGEGDTVLVAVGNYPAEILNLERPVTIRGVCLDATLGTRSLVSGRSAGVRIENIRFQGSTRGPVAWSGDLTLRSVAVRDVSLFGLASFGGDIDAEDVSIRGVSDEGVRIDGGAHLVARRLDVEDVSVTILSCHSSTCELEDVSLIQRASSPATDHSVRFSDNENTRLERVFIHNEQTDQMVISGTSATMSDVVVRGPAIERNVDDPALFVVEGSTLEMDRVWLSGMHVAAIIVGSPGTSVVARDVVVTDVHHSGMAAGYGVFVTQSAHLDVERIWVERATAAGILISGTGTRVVASDLNVRRVRPVEDGFLGRGIQVQLGGALEATRIHVEDTLESGIIVSQGASATLRDLVVSDIHERLCTPSGCPPAGNGVAAYLGASADLERFRVSRTSLAALQLAMDGEIDAHDGEVFDNPVGVNLQAEGYDLSRVTTDVVYRDNGVNLDSASFEIPDPTAPPVGI